MRYCVGLFVSLILLTLSGCGSLGAMAKSHADNGYKLTKDRSGILYGIVTIDKISVKDACAIVANNDPRCSPSEQTNYKVTVIGSAFGYFSAFAGITALAPVDMNTGGCLTGGSECHYVRAKAEAGKLGTVLEVVSLPGDNKCYWHGLPRIGGVVCPAYQWDYRNDLNDWNTTNGVMKVNQN